MLYQPNLRPQDLEAFYRKFIKGREDECWEWNAYKMKSGHGQIRIQGVLHYAYRIAYFLVNGPFDDYLQVCHDCDNGACMNTKHMFLGTFKDNMQDKLAKNRQCKDYTFLTDEQIKEIFKLGQEGILTNEQIGKKFGLAQSYISRILNGHRLRHLSVKLGMISA